MAAILDDTYANYGTYEELETFTEAVQRGMYQHWKNMNLSFVTAGYKMLTPSSFISMGEMVTKEAFKWVMSFSTLVKAASIINRIMDDIIGHKEERERKHVVSTVECYMKEQNVTEEYVYDLFNKRVEDAWKDMNQDLLIMETLVRPFEDEICGIE
ncbi:hypothetical protein L1987_83135 [Smallanthus sonchifolius]|uniref:Uncharacterized protein n=1 Tax=Smallanthus sonchifolius TaxID=185202 RepID=A0ACB8YAZ7_9ASTR|nr:hypothetical protein L1987_83135 [Smallanthus sonchifolius]